MNIIPTAILILMQAYWIIAIAGFLDLDFFNIDVDLEGADGGGLLNAIAVFMKIGKIPFGLVFSLIVLNFWIIVMLMYFLPFEAGGFFTGILLLPALVVSIYVTKIETLPLRRFFYERKNVNNIEQKVLKRRCTLKCDLEQGRLGQADVQLSASSIVINVKTQFEEDSFKKDEIGFVFRKDNEKDIYYIAKPLTEDEFNLKEIEEE